MFKDRIWGNEIDEEVDEKVDSRCRWSRGDCWGDTMVVEALVVKRSTLSNLDLASRRVVVLRREVRTTSICQRNALSRSWRVNPPGLEIEF